MLERVDAIPEGLVGTYGDVSPGAPRYAGTVLFGADELFARRRSASVIRLLGP